MSKEQTIFTKILTGILIGVGVLIIGGLYSFHIMTVRFESRYAEKIVSIEEKQAATEISITAMHNKDVNNLKEGVWEIKVNQRDMLATQKEILKLLNKK